MAQLRAGTWARLCISRAVLDRDGHTCRYRGQPAETLDPVIARMDGGRDDPNNLVAYCRGSNGEGGRAAERF
jgi:5-methylcytosine-specific restriction endonuclease McrA